MSSDSTDEIERPTGGEHQGTRSPAPDAAHREAVVVVRGEAVPDRERQAASRDAASGDSQRPEAPPAGQGKSQSKEVSEEKAARRSRLPTLDDDAEVGTAKEHIVTRDGKADLAFTGTLLASAAPSSAPKGQWQEYRVYETSAGKHVFSKVSRSVFAEDQDTYEAEIFDPSPASVPSQLLRSARELARAKPLTWVDAAAAFFGYDPLAKALYRKLGGRFEEHVS